MNTTKRQLSLNYNQINKGDPTKMSYAGAWETRSCTRQEIADHIDSGRAIMPAILKKGATRSRANVLYADHLALDFDNGITFSDALQIPLIRDHAAIAYHTPSSTPEHNKFRVCFELQSRITGSDAINFAIRGLMAAIGFADEACKDSCRFFWGSNKGKAFVFDSPPLPDALIKEMIEGRAAAQEAQKREQANRQSSFNSIASADPDLKRRNIENAMTYMPVRIKGAGTYDSCRDALWGLCAIVGASEAAMLWRRHDSHFDQIDQVCGAFVPGGGINAGTFWHIAKMNGFKAEYPSREKKIAVAIQKNREIVVTEAKEEIKEAHFDFKNEIIKLDFLAQAAIQQSLITTHQTTRNEKYLSLDDIATLRADHDVFILNSKMGTGKTTAVEKFFYSLPGERVLISLSHRTTLAGKIEEMKDLSNHKYVYSRCYDSIAQLADLVEFKKVDILFLDEICQGLAHVYQAGTIKIKQLNVFKQLQRLIKKVISDGGVVIAGEAGVNLSVGRFIDNLNLAKPPYMIHNTYTPEGYSADVIVGSHQGSALLLLDLEKRLEAGQNVYLTSTTKTLIDILRTHIAKKYPDLIKDCYFIESENSSTALSRALSKDATKFVEERKPRLIAHSPSIVSGISIDSTTDHFDVVMAWATCGLPSDMAQMLMRVRDMDIDRIVYTTGHTTDANQGQKKILSMPEENVARNNNKDITEALGVGSGIIVSDSTNEWVKLEAARLERVCAIESMYYKDVLVNQLETAGHKVNLMSADEMSTKYEPGLFEDMKAAMKLAEKEAQQQLNLQQTENDAAARMIDLPTAEKKASSWNSNAVDLAVYRQRKLYDEVAGDTTPTLHFAVVDASNCKGGKKIKNARNAFISTINGLAESMNREARINSAMGGMSNYGNIADPGQTFAKCEVIRKFEWIKAELLVDGLTFSENSDLIQKIYAQVQVEAGEISRLINLSLKTYQKEDKNGIVKRYNTAIPCVKAILELMGEEIEFTGTKVIENDKLVRLYQLKDNTVLRSELTKLFSYKYRDAIASGGVTMPVLPDDGLIAHYLLTGDDYIGNPTAVMPIDGVNHLMDRYGCLGYNEPATEDEYYPTE
jgi:hypothetical protein